MIKYTAVFILLCTSILKLYSLYEDQPILEQYDPVTSIQYRTLMMGVGVVELLICAFILSGAGTTMSGYMLVFLAVCMALYRVFLIAFPSIGMCPCLGSLSLFEGNDFLTSIVLWVTVLYLFCAGVYLLFQGTGFGKVVVSANGSSQRNEYGYGEDPGVSQRSSEM